MSFQSLTPDFREALRNMADGIAEKNIKEKLEEKVKIRVAMNTEKEEEEIEIIEDEGNSANAEKK
jgi:hypothetical protein